MNGLGKDEAYQIESRIRDTQGTYISIVKKKNKKKSTEDNPNIKQTNERMI